MTIDKHLSNLWTSKTSDEVSFCQSLKEREIEKNKLKQNRFLLRPMLIVKTCPIDINEIFSVFFLMIFCTVLAVIWVWRGSCQKLVICCLPSLTMYLFELHILIIDIIWFAYTTKKRNYVSEAWKRDCAAVCDFEMMPKLICQK